jgi:hypothetical protein
MRIPGLFLVCLLIPMTALTAMAASPPGSPLNPGPGDKWISLGRVHDQSGVSMQYYLDAGDHGASRPNERPAHIWFIYDSVQKEARGSFVEADLNLLLNCPDKKIFSGEKDYHGADGRIAFMDKEPKERLWAAIEPDTVAQDMYDKLCQ